MFLSTNQWFSTNARERLGGWLTLFSGQQTPFVISVLVHTFCSANFKLFASHPFSASKVLLFPFHSLWGFFSYLVRYSCHFPQRFSLNVCKTILLSDNCLCRHGYCSYLLRYWDFFANIHYDIQSLPRKQKCAVDYSDRLAFASRYKHGTEDWSNYCTHSLAERYVARGVGGWHEINYIW